MIKKIVLSYFFENCYLLVDDISNDAILIDPGIGLEKKLDLIKDYHILAVLITHAHVDHIDSMGLFNVPIYISNIDYDALSNDDLTLYKEFHIEKKFDISNLNIIKVYDNEEIQIKNFKIKVFITPGHTKGSTCYLYKDILFTGDTLFNMSVGRTDFPGGSSLDLRNSLKRLASLNPNIKIYPGHGEESTISYELKNNPFIQ